MVKQEEQPRQPDAQTGVGIRVEERGDQVRDDLRLTGIRHVPPLSQCRPDEVREGRVGRNGGYLISPGPLRHGGGREIANLVAAIAKGADPSLLVEKQTELKATRDSLRQRLGIVQGEMASLPDPAAVQAEASTLRKQLARTHKGKDWRKESPESLERFLEFLFGTDPRRDGLGIYLHRDRNGGALTASIRARLYLRSPGSPVVETADMLVQFDRDMMEDEPFEPGDVFVGWHLSEEVVAANRATTSPTARTPTSTPTSSASCAPGRSCRSATTNTGAGSSSTTSAPPSRRA
jgi:hypothetical protein